MGTPTHQVNPPTADRMEQVYRQYRRLVLAVIARRLRPADRQDTEDLAQVTMLRAWRCLDTQVAPNAMASWLRTIAAHAVTDYYRHRARHPEAPTSPDAPVWGTLQQPTADWLNYLSEALETLPPRAAAALMLREGHGLYGREIAATLRCSKPTADRLARDGLAALRAELRAGVGA
jgi:RNA polymerase sigma factor (sigma-70 family)